MRFAGTQLSNFMGDTTDFSQIAGTSQKGRSMERRAVMQGEGMVANAGVQSLGKMKSAEFQADSIIAQGKAQGQAAMASGFGSLASGLAGGISSRFSNSLPKVGTPARANADMSTLRGWTQQDHNNFWRGAFSN